MWCNKVYIQSQQQVGTASEGKVNSEAAACELVINNCLQM